MMGAPGRPPSTLPLPEPAPSGLLAALDGKKTYLIVGLGVLVVALNVAGVLNADQMQHLLDVLGLGAMATLRYAIAGNATAIAKTTPKP